MFICYVPRSNSFWAYSDAFEEFENYSPVLGASNLDRKRKHEPIEFRQPNSGLKTVVIKMINKKNLSTKNTYWNPTEYASLKSVIYVNLPMILILKMYSRHFFEPRMKSVRTVAVCRVALIRSHFPIDT